MLTPQVFVNIFKFHTEHAGENLFRSREAAVQDAEEWESRYLYTLTDTGRIDLRPEFSEAYHDSVARDSRTDAQIDARKEARAS